MAVKRNCSDAEWTRWKNSGWASECLDILAPDGRRIHVHGTWIGWHEGDLVIVLSAPFEGHRAGHRIVVQPIVQLWRPSERKFVYRPRWHLSQLPVELQQWLQDNPAWDTDNTVVPGPDRHQ